MDQMHPGNSTFNKTPAALVWCGWLGCALFFHFGPLAVREAVEAFLIQSAGGMLVVVDEFTGSWSRSTREQHDDRERLEQLEAENRRLVLQVAELDQKLHRLSLSGEETPFSDGSSSAESDDETPLLHTRSITARVLGRLGTRSRSAEQSSAKRSAASGELRFLVRLGERAGVVGEELVLGNEGVLIDRGDSSELQRDQLVWADRGLFGRTVAVGRWTSAVQPVTHPEFRIGVRIVRRSPRGPVFGSRGILSGTGDGCRLLEVPATEPVVEGDFVYTDAALTPGAEAVYCGRVVRAEVGPNDGQWTIDVAPLHRPEDIPRELHVLRAELNLGGR
jgi:cell shape-determining protein MreC